jgi:hypothetical protein
MITAKRPAFRPRQVSTGAVYMGEASPRSTQSPPARRGPIAIRANGTAPASALVRRPPRGMDEHD